MGEEEKGTRGEEEKRRRGEEEKGSQWLYELHERRLANGWPASNSPGVPLWTQCTPQRANQRQGLSLLSTVTG
ncbi:hypothetical protein NHX12_006554 [Muraenolepis orangiensis]|uniref:Uncharacterized protein n=1 Tax=Muraenolepis orangiensis TaxID=630683 RepID=A0A9Q0IDW6_9TELE|nr:hypothetical protein NHX12_006554 [Muraenolepis orangiensis]